MRVWTVAAVLLLGLPIAAGAQTAAAGATEPDGAALYRQNCRSCHGVKGVPPARMLTLYPTLKTLADSTEQAHLTEASIVTVLQHGKGKDMKAFADRLSPAEMAAVAKFVKSLNAPPAGSTGP
jgi:mono/diheme cytochrome c family protein